MLWDSDEEMNPLGLDDWYNNIEKEENEKFENKIKDFKSALKNRLKYTSDWSDLIRQTKGGYVPLFCYGSLKPMHKNHPIIKENSFNLGNASTISDEYRIHKSAAKKVACAYKEGSDKINEHQANKLMPIGGYLFMTPVYKILELDRLFFNGHVFLRKKIPVNSITRLNYQPMAYRALTYMPNEKYWKQFDTSDVHTTTHINGRSCCYYTT